jgi:hypothetical protein
VVLCVPGAIVAEKPGRGTPSARKIHRLWPLTHLPSSWNYLFCIAAGSFVAVIYIIIAKEMKTNAIQTADIASSLFTRAHGFTAIAGILIAVISTLVLLRDIAPSQYKPRQSGFVKPSAAALSHQMVKAADLSAGAAMSILK